jgi:hypothetical protein
MLTPQETEKALVALREAYAAFNRLDIDAAVSTLDPRIDWNEPAEFPGGALRGCRRCEAISYPTAFRRRRSNQ